MIGDRSAAALLPKTILLVADQAIPSIPSVNKEATQRSQWYPTRKGMTVNTPSALTGRVPMTEP
jgi:hypothetical protein